MKTEEQHVTEKMEIGFSKYPSIQEHMKDSLKWYVLNGRDTGGFLEAILENSLFEAFGRADEKNQAVMFDYVKMIYNDFPMSCWGNPEKVKEWKQKGGLLGKEVMGE